MSLPVYIEFGKWWCLISEDPVSVAWTPWMNQYLAGFGLEVDILKSVSCNQPFIFGPSKRYVSKLLVELPILVTRMDGKEDVL